MLPVTNPAATRRLGAPPNWDQARDGECGALEIADVIDEKSGNRVMESLWRPAPEELAALNAGAAVVLGIFGATHPVVYLGCTAPPKHDLPEGQA